MIKMTELMRNLLRSALADGTPCLVGTASRDGKPQISPKGSVGVLDDGTLFYWERSLRTAYAHIGENPHVVVYYRNFARTSEIPYPGAAMRFHGRARIVKAGPEREKVWDATIPAERERDPKKAGVGVLIDVDRIEQLSGAVIMQRDG
jgi:predicted pyridoxine 5'-phosphate oxidase superfamily flavin-nucleotide-binding protein